VKRLADQIVQHAGTHAAPGTAVIDSLGRPDSARLVSRRSSSGQQY
jgi:hypothetical protein